MIKDGEPWLIDFQGGRKGPVYYDVASFLWQAKANYPDSLRQELLKEYIDALRKYQPVDEAYFYAQLRHFVLFRTMQVLGARRSPTSYKVSPSPSRTCASCSKSLIPNIPTSAGFCANSPS